LKTLGEKQLRSSEPVYVLDELVRSGLYIDSRTLIRAKQKIRGHIAERDI
jgi:hypothetical protein